MITLSLLSAAAVALLVSSQATASARPVGDSSDSLAVVGTSAAAPVFFTNPQPQDYSTQALTGTLRRKLTSEEMSLVVNPLVSTPEMREWACELTVAATNDLEKAKALYAGILGRTPTQPDGSNDNRTAQQVFSAWDTPATSFSCEELAYLYVALARAAGLKAYCVSVDQQCDGTKDLHGCAAVFADRKCLLVDPAYRWFGAPHKKFVVLDDLQTAAVYLCAMGNLKSCQVACKLAPQLIFVRGGVFQGLVSEGRWKEAAEEAVVIMRLDPDAPLTLYARAALACHEGKLDETIELLHRAIAMAPHTAPLYIALGGVYMDQGKLTEARQAYQDALRYPVDEHRAEHARAAIGHINDMDARDWFARATAQQMKGDWDGALASCERVVELKPTFPEAYLARGIARQHKGDVGGALSDLGKAIELHPSLFEAYYNRGLVEQTSGAQDAALADYDEAIRLSPDMADAYIGRGYTKQSKADLEGAFSDYCRAVKLNPGLGPAVAPLLRSLGCLHYDRHRLVEALADFRKASEVGSPEVETELRIWATRSRLGETGAAKRELQAYLVSREAGDSSDWPSTICRFLLGQVTESQLFRAAETPGSQRKGEKHCQAYFYAGVKRLVVGDKKTAASRFEKCVATGATDRAEYMSAAAELSFLMPPN